MKIFTFWPFDPFAGKPRAQYLSTLWFKWILGVGKGSSDSVFQDNLFKIWQKSGGGFRVGQCLISNSVAVPRWKRECPKPPGVLCLSLE